MSNPNDGTQLGTSEVISDEFVDPNAGVRTDPAVPLTGYKLPRSKIVVGPYGVDGGDASHAAPLPTESRVQRWFEELAAMRVRDQSLELMSKSIFENSGLADSRGAHMSSRFQR